jgi:hypothetical protein
MPPPTREEATNSSEATESTDFLRPFLGLVCFFELSSSDELESDERLSLSLSPFFILTSSLVARCSLPKAVLIVGLFFPFWLLDALFDLAPSAPPRAETLFDLFSFSFPAPLDLVSFTNSSQGYGAENWACISYPA